MTKNPAGIAAFQKVCADIGLPVPTEEEAKAFYAFADALIKHDEAKAAPEPDTDALWNEEIDAMHHMADELDEDGMPDTASWLRDTTRRLVTYRKAQPATEAVREALKQARRYVEDRGEPDGEPWYVTEDGTSWSAFDVTYRPDRAAASPDEQKDKP